MKHHAVIWTLALLCTLTLRLPAWGWGLCLENFGTEMSESPIWDCRYYCDQQSQTGCSVTFTMYQIELQYDWVCNFCNSSCTAGYALTCGASKDQYRCETRRSWSEECPPEDQLLLCLAYAMAACSNAPACADDQLYFSAEEICGVECPGPFCVPTHCPSGCP